MALFDLASLTKCLVTAPLALWHLDLDRDRRSQLGFEARETPLSVRQLLSHSAGLPPWLPYTGEPLALQLARGFPAGKHPLLREGRPGEALYSDLGYRLVAALLEQETGREWRELGWELTGLTPAPWAEAPFPVPQGPDLEAWRIAAPELVFPRQQAGMPNDANARAGMRGHAGFAAGPDQMRAWLTRWIAQGLPLRMAQEVAQGADGSAWGLGLQRSFAGGGRYGQLLSTLPEDLSGVHVLSDEGVALATEAPPLQEGRGIPTGFWMHFGFTGPALFVRPETNLAICLLLHRLGPQGELLDNEALRARRWALLKSFTEGMA